MLSQHDMEWGNVVCLNDPLKICETMKYKDASKWEVAMQEEYDYLMANET